MYWMTTKLNTWDSLVIHWLRIRLPVQGTQVQSLVWKDPTCHGANKLICDITAEPTLTACAPQHRNHHSEKPIYYERAAPAHCN